MQTVSNQAQKGVYVHVRRPNPCFSVITSNTCFSSFKIVPDNSKWSRTRIARLTGGCAGLSVLRRRHISLIFRWPGSRSIPPSCLHTVCCAWYRAVGSETGQSIFGRRQRPSQRWFRIYKQYARHWHVNSPVAAAGVASAAISLNRRLAGARRLGSTHNPATFNCFEDRNSHQSSKKCEWKSTYWNIFSTSKKTFVKQPRNETINVR